MMHAKYSRLILFAASIFLSSPANGDSPIITVLGERSSNLGAIAKIADDYRRSTGTRVVIEQQPFDSLMPLASRDLALGIGKYDVVLQYNFELSSYVEGQYIWSINELKVMYPKLDRSFEARLFPNVWKEVGYYAEEGDIGRGPKPFGYPFAANTLLLVYNREMFDGAVVKFKKKYHREINPPRTWKEFGELAEFFTNKKLGTCGVTLQGATGGWLYYEWATIVNSSGARLLPKSFGWERKADVPVNLNRPEIITPTQLYLSLAPYNCGDYFDNDAIGQTNQMKSGKVAMALMWSDYLYPLAFPNGVASKQFGYAVIPGNTSPMAGGSFYINRHSRHRESAIKFLIWLQQPEQQRKLVRYGLLSPMESTYDSAVEHDVPYATALLQSIKRGTYGFEANRDAELIQREITFAMRQAWRSPKSVNQIFFDATGRINRARQEVFSPER